MAAAGGTGINKKTTFLMFKTGGDSSDHEAPEDDKTDLVFVFPVSCFLKS